METIRCRNNYGEIVELPRDRFNARPSVYAVFNKGNRILVCRARSNGKLWLPGGGVEKGETHEQALRREVEEEAGITDVKIGRLIADFQNYCYYAPLDEACDAQLYFYECETEQENTRPNEEIEDGEAMDFTWMEMEKVLAEEFCDASDKIHEVLKTFYVR